MEMPQHVNYQALIKSWIGLMREQPSQRVLQGDLEIQGIPDGPTTASSFASTRSATPGLSWRPEVLKTPKVRGWVGAVRGAGQVRVNPDE